VFDLLVQCIVHLLVDHGTISFFARMKTLVTRTPGPSAARPSGNGIPSQQGYNRIEEGRYLSTAKGAGSIVAFFFLTNLSLKINLF